MLRELLHGLIAPSLKEDGCLNYELHTSNDNPAKFMFHQNWATQAALDKHQQSPHVKAAIENGSDLLAGPFEVSVWKKL